MISHLLITEKKRSADKYLKEKLLAKNDLFFEITPEGKKYAISEVKQVLGEIKIYNPKKRVFYFPSFDASSLEAQNAMLKILEEPPQGVLFVLTSNSVSRLLPTIVSRTKVIKIENASALKPDAKISAALKAFLDNGQLSKLDFAAFQAKTLEEALEVSDQICLFFKHLLKSDKNSPKVIREVLRLRGLIENNNITPQMTIDHMLIFISKTYNMKL